MLSEVAVHIRHGKAPFGVEKIFKLILKLVLKKKKVERKRKMDTNTNPSTNSYSPLEYNARIL